MERVVGVLVVGAGPTGLVLACALWEAGVPARVIDAATGPAVTSRALGLQPRGMEVMDRVGALGDLAGRGVTVRSVIINVDGREITRLRIGGVTRLVERPGVMMSQAEVEGNLRARLAELGGHIEWDTPYGPAREHGDWVVGCDGAHSAVRKAAGIGFPGVPLIEQFLIADIHAGLPLPRDAVSTWLQGDEMFALFPLPGADLWRVLVPYAAEVTDDLVPRLLHERTGLPADAVTGCEWTSTFRIHRRLADTYRSGRMLLAGDAAHIHSPFGGQGMNTGLGDAENLAWKLALVEKGRAGEELLDTYEAERRPVAAGVLGTTSSMTRMMLGRTALGRVMRDHVVVPLMNRGFVQRRIAEGSSQLRVSYRSGPLAHGRGSGDRVPDMPCTRADGTPTRLYAELGGRWAILNADYAPLDAVVLRSAGTTPMLIRPDGHLACRGDVETIDRWVRDTLAAA